MLMVLLRDKRKHTPVDQIRTVSLGRILIGNIRPAAKHLLTGRRLLTGRTVARLHGKDRASDAYICFIHIGTDIMNGLKHRLQLRNGFRRTVARFHRFLCKLNGLCLTYIFRIFSGQCEFRQSQRI